jgi:mTERF domain-containing protein, mitochondrial
MSTLIPNRISSFFRSCFYQHRRLPLPTPLLCISFSTQTPEQAEVPFLARYLISSLGFPPDRARKLAAHKLVVPIKSEDGPELVIKFLRGIGFSDTQIRGVISFRPDLLSSNVDKTLKPKVRELMDAGFSGELLVPLIRYNPSALFVKDTLSRLHFWRDFVGNCDQGLIKIIQKNGLLITYDIDNYVIPRVNLLNDYGFSNQDILKLLGSGNCRFVSRSLDSLKQTFQFIEELGIPKKSRMFLAAFRSLKGYNTGILVRKVEFLKMTYGWSQEVVSSAFKKNPSILAVSEDKIKANMNFLIQKVMLEPRSIASQPLLLSFSLEKRLAPRHHVLSILAAKGLKRKLNFSCACSYTEEKFLELFVEPYKEDVPELAEAYFAAAARNISD